MFGSIGGPELVLILALALLLFGPRKLPEIGRTIGRALAEFRSVTHGFRASLEREVELDELRATEREIRKVGSESTQALREASSVARGTIPAGDALAQPEQPERPDGADDGAGTPKP